MTYTPTPTERKQDKALVKFLEVLQNNVDCASSQISDRCSISGGARSRRGRATQSRARHTAEKQSDSGTESDGSSPSPSQRRSRSKKPTPIKKKAERECEKEEEWMQYFNIARVLVISGTVGAGALAMTGVFSGYADAMMETLGYGSISRACGEGNYLINYGASRVIPGMKSCAEVTRIQQGVIAKAWGGLVALGAAFKISMPKDFSATPGAMIDGLAKMLCRYFKERELHNELMQKLAARNSGISQADIDRAVAQALAAQQAQMQAQQPAQRARSPSRSRSRSPPRSRRGRAPAEEQQSSPSPPKQMGTPSISQRRRAPPASAPVRSTRNQPVVVDRSVQSAPNTPESPIGSPQSQVGTPQSVESDEESDNAGKVKTPSPKKSPKSKKAKKKSPPKGRRSTRRRNNSKSKGGKKANGRKTKSKYHKKKRSTHRRRN